MKVNNYASTKIWMLIYVLIVILILMMVFSINVEARPKKKSAAYSYLPFAPKAKVGKHHTWKQKPVRKHKVLNCVKFWS